MHVKRKTGKNPNQSTQPVKLFTHTSLSARITDRFRNKIKPYANRSVFLVLDANWKRREMAGLLEATNSP